VVTFIGSGSLACFSPFLQQQQRNIIIKTTMTGRRQINIRIVKILGLKITYEIKVNYKRLC
jgi:hypothetical protein